MRNFARLAVAVTAITVASLAVGSTNLHASDCHSYRPIYKTITVYETVTVPYVTYVTKYSDCGKAYRYKVTSYRTVKVPVEKRVKVSW